MRQTPPSAYEMETVRGGTVHHAMTETSINTTCNATTAHISNSTTDPRAVTCKRCLKVLNTADPTIPLTPKTAATPRSATAGMDERKAEKNAAIDGPIAPTKAPTKAPRATRPASTKVPTVHAPASHDNPTATGTLCNIPGATALEGITCKVCLAKLNGTKPTNAIPDEVKAARKAFKSFIARASYMAYMDADCGSVDWSTSFMTLGGILLSVESDMGGTVLKANGLVVGTATDKAELLAEIETLCWSCGEEK